MSTKTIQQILGYVSLTGVIQGIKTGIPDNLPESFAKLTKPVVGDSGRYTRVIGTRQTARRSEYGAPAVQRALKDVEAVDVKLNHAFEYITLKPLILQQLRAYDNYNLQQMGVDEVDRQQAEFRVYFDNLRLAMVYSMLANGAIWFDANGNLLPSSTGARVTISFQMNANNQNQLAGIIANSWKLFNTDIPSQLRSLRLQAAKLTGYPLKYAFYGLNVPSYLTQNNYVLDYLSRNPNFAQKFLEQAEIPDGLFGFTWVPVYTSFFQDQNGVNQTVFGSDEVVFTPDITREVYEMLEGTYFVPSSFNASADAAAALATLKQVVGMFSYATPSHNVPSVSMFAGDTSLPVIKVPDAYFEATVAF